MTDLDQPLLSLFRINVSIHNLNKAAERSLGISLVQWCLLRRLVDLPAISAHPLAKAVGVHPSTLTQTLKRLARKKLIFVSEDPRDSRRKLVSITREGKQTLDSLNQRIGHWSENLRKARDGLDLVERELTRLRIEGSAPL